MINLPKGYGQVGNSQPHALQSQTLPTCLGQQTWFTYCPVFEYKNFFFKILGATTVEGTKMKQNYKPQCVVYKQQKFYKFFVPQIYSPEEGGREGALVRNDRYSQGPVTKFL